MDWRRNAQGGKIRCAPPIGHGVHIEIEDTRGHQRGKNARTFMSKVLAEQCAERLNLVLRDAIAIDSRPK